MNSLNQPLDIMILESKQELLITWQNEQRSLVAASELRWQCPCAQCVDEMTGKRILIDQKAFRQTILYGFETVGRYALKFDFSDGHRTGIYSYDYLRSICDVKP